MRETSVTLVLPREAARGTSVKSVLSLLFLLKYWALLNHGMKKISLKSKTFVDTGFYDRPI
jgi:hypothetical protein